MAAARRFERRDHRRGRRRFELTLGVPGEDAQGVYKACDFLNALARKEKIRTGGEVVVIGGATPRSTRPVRPCASVLRSQWSTDGPKSTCPLMRRAERRARGGHRPHLHGFARRDCDEQKDGKRIAKAVRIQRMKAGPVDSSGRPTPIPTDKFRRHLCSTVILAIEKRSKLPASTRSASRP